MIGQAESAFSNRARRLIHWIRSFFTNQSSSFTYLNVTQFLGVLNDNIYKLLIAFFIIQLEGQENSARVLATAGATFVIPFLLFSSPSGMLADRLSKRNIIVFAKILEFVIMAGGVIAFLFESILGSYAILFLMATQSAIFGPSKYGIIPELVASDRINRANGLLSSFTFLGIVVGTFLASFLIQISGRNFILAALVCTLIALIGVITSFCIEYTLPAGSQKKINPWFLWEVYQSLQVAKQDRTLLTALFASAYFLFMGAFFQLALIPFAVQMLGLTDVEGGYLFLLTAVGIGVGSVVAAKASGTVVELGLVPIGAIGIIIGCFLMDIWSAHLIPVILLVFWLGLCGGMYVVPLDSYVQIASPNEWRGQLVATTNFFGFLGALGASIFVYTITEVLHLKADKGFTLLGILTIGVNLLFGYQFFDYFSRFSAMAISHLRFRPTYLGREGIPDEAAIYVCTHTAWNDTLLLMGAQRRRMRFFVEQEQHHKRWMIRLYRLMRVAAVPSIETLEANIPCLKQMEKLLAKGISVCLFVESTDVQGEIERLSQTFRQLRPEIRYPMIAVQIDKGEKTRQPRMFAKIWRMLRCPAVVTLRSV